MKNITILTAIILSALILGCVTSRDIPDPNSMGTLLIDFRGNSMLPVYAPDQTIMMRMDWNGIEIGSDVGNLIDGEVILHRVIAPGVVKDVIVLSWRTRGLANNFNDIFHVWPSTYYGTAERVIGNR